MVVEILRNFVQAHPVEHHVGHIVYDLRGDFIEYEVQLDDGQNLIVNEYTKDTAEVHTDGEKVHLSFDPLRISLYDVNEEVLSL